MQYNGRHDGYTATQDEVAALPDWYLAVRQHGQFNVPAGRYRGQSIDGQRVPMVVDITFDWRGDGQESWSRIVIQEGV